MTQKLKCSKLESGYLVLLCHKTFKGKHKIKDRWEMLCILFSSTALVKSLCISKTTIWGQEIQDCTLTFAIKQDF